MALKSKLEATESNGDIDSLERAPTYDVSVSLSRLKKMTPIDIEFNDLTYTIPYGRKGMIMIVSIKLIE